MVKGSGLLSTKKFFDHKFGFSYFRDNWHKYYPGISSQISVSSWYPLEPNIRWHFDSALLADDNAKNYLLGMSTYTVGNDLKGVYSFFIKLGGIKRIFGLMPLLTNAYMNCMKGKVLSNKENYLKMEIICPTFAKEWQIIGYEGGVTAIIEIFAYKKNQFNILHEEEFLIDNLEHSKIVFELLYNK